MSPAQARADRQASREERAAAIRGRIDAATPVPAAYRAPTAAVAVRSPAAVATTGRAPLDGAAILSDCSRFLRHFAQWPSRAASDLVTLYLAACHAREPDTGDPVWEYVAKLFFTSSEYGSGKSWFATLSSQLAPDGKVLLEPTKASLIDEIADHKTVVISELDELLATPGRNRGIVAVINGCYQQGLYHTRKSGGRVQEIHLFGPMILDGLDSLLKATRPDTRAIVSRSHVIHVRMADPGYRRPKWDKTARAIAARGRDRLAAWMADEVANGIGDLVPDLPEGLGSPRRCALYEPLFAVALRADRGDPEGYWSTAIRDASLQLEAAQDLADEDDEDGSELDAIMSSWGDE